MATAAQRLAIEFGITNIVNYLRRSRQDLEHEKKTGEDTLDQQKKLMERVLADYGIPYDQAMEIGSGDKISTRPVFQEVIEDLENEKYDAIAVKEISRMGRGSYTDMGIIYDLITEKRIYVITPWKIYDPTNVADLRQIRFELFMSREEFETTRERLVGGRYNAALEGRWVSGPAPFGYDYNKKTKRLIINDEEAETVQALFDFYANGIIQKNGKRRLVQFRALATYLTRLGIKTPRGNSEWSPIQVRQLLENERYIGVLRYNTTYTTSDGKKLPRPEEEHVIAYDAHPPIIDAETWEKTQDRMNNRDTHTNTRLDFEPNRLAGICICKVCGKRLIRRAGSRTYTKKDGTVSVYRNKFLTCNTVGCMYVKYENVEDDILETLKFLKDLDKDVFKLQVDNITAKEPEENEEDVTRYIETKHKDIKRRLKFIQEKHEAGVYTDEMFLERRAELEKELIELEKVKVEEPAPPQSETLDVDFIKENISSALEMYKNASSDTDKNKVLHSIFSHVNVEIIEKGRGRRPAVHEIEPFLKSSFLTKGI